MQILQLSFLGVVPQPEHSEYHFRITNRDMSARRLILMIERSAFLNNQLMIQEGPDLCYQKALENLTSEAPCHEDVIHVTESDIARYRESHPRSLQPRSHRKRLNKTNR